MSENSNKTVSMKMTALADEVRELSGSETIKTIDNMTSDVNAANTEISEQMELIAQISTALEGKASSSGGMVLPTLDNPASATDILGGKEAIDGSGNKITGTIATKTSSNLTASGATVTVPAGYYASNATKSVATATQATPTVTINSSTGLVTATATQTAGYVAAGSKSGTLQLAFQAAQTITPGTTNKTIAANTYLGGVQTIKGDANLVASNIVSGKSIFGVVGTYEGGGGDTSIEDGLITKQLSGSYTNDRITTIPVYAFSQFYNLESVNFPQCTLISNYAFGLCSKLKTINFPLCSLIGSDAFRQCYSLNSVNIPACTKIRSAAFIYCSALQTISLPLCSAIEKDAFAICTNLSSIYLGRSLVCSLYNSSVFRNTKIGSSKGSIFVPASLVNSYKTATNWTYFSNRIFSYSFT